MATGSGQQLSWVCIGQWNSVLSYRTLSEPALCEAQNRLLDP